MSHIHSSQVILNPSLDIGKFRHRVRTKSLEFTIGMMRDLAVWLAGIVSRFVGVVRYPNFEPGPGYRNYRSELHLERTPKSLQTACILVIVIMTGFVALDYWAYPDEFRSFLLLRITLNSLLAVLIVTARRWPATSQFVACYAIGIVLLIVLHRTGGVNSNYYVGLILLFMGIPPLCTLNGIQAAVVMGSLVLGFLGLEVLRTTPTSDPVVLTHICFLATAAGVCVFCSWLLDRARYSEFRHRMELNRTLEHVETFAKAVSHDIRNPVTAASEALRVARSQPLLASNGLIDLAGENLVFADQMISGLSDLMQITGIRGRTQRVDAKEICKSVVKELRLTSRVANVDVRVVGTWVAVEASADRISHIFRNLIGNAISHNRNKQDLQIELSQQIESDQVRFCVRDNGRGVDPALSDEIFAPFKRGLDPNHESLGLGLAIVQGIVRQWGGRIWFTPTQGGGATFLFTVPRARF